MTETNRPESDSPKLIASETTASESSVPENGAPKIDDEVRALREDVAALKDLLQTRPRTREAARDIIATPEQERIARQLRDQLIRSEDELTEARKTMLRLERHLDQSETQRRKMLESRTWKWGKTLASIGMAPLNTAKAIYSWLLKVLPAPANRALRQAVANARGGRPVTLGTAGTPGGRRSTGRAAGATGGTLAQPLVPIPVHGPEGVGAELTAPAVLLVAYGVDEAVLVDLVEQVNYVRREVDGLRVLFVTDCDAFHVFRAHSMLFEYLPSRIEWERHGFERSYDEFRAARFTEIFHVYGPDRVIHVRDAEDLRGLPSGLFSAA